MKRLISITIYLLLVGCSTHLPGNPRYNWLNGVWNGRGDYWEQTFMFEVVDGNKVVGWQESRNEALGIIGRGELVGEIVDSGDTGWPLAIMVTVYKKNTTEYIITVKDGNLVNRGIVLKKVR